MTKTLVMVSDLKLSIALKCYLTYNSFNVTLASSLLAGKKLLEQVDFKLIVIDARIQNDTFTFVRNLRSKGIFLPILYIGEGNQKDDMVKNCTGLDEFILKPVAYLGLKESLQRTLLKSHSAQKPLLYGGINIDERKQVVSISDRIVALGRMEMRILMLLAKKAGKVVTLDKINSMVEHEGARFNNRVFYHVACLRRKLEDGGLESLQINFVKDGYRLDVV